MYKLIVLLLIFVNFNIFSISHRLIIKLNRNDLSYSTNIELNLTKYIDIFINRTVTFTNFSYFLPFINDFKLGLKFKFKNIKRRFL